MVPRASVRFAFPFGPAVFAYAILAFNMDAAEPASPPEPARESQIWTFRPDLATPAQPVRTRSDWAQRRQEIIRQMEDIMGPFPTPNPPAPWNVEITEETDAGSYIRRLLHYTSDPGPRVPAYLLIPKKALSSTRPVPGVLCLHPTDNVHGHQVVVGLGGKANRNYAQELAERGFVTFAPAYPLLANYQPDWRSLGYHSGTMKAIWDNIRGLDYLASLPFVSTNGFGAIGHSLGGHNAVFTAVFDPRIKAVISSCGLDSFRDYMNGDIRGWTSDRYMPRLLEYRDRLDELPFDFHEVLAALAPRHCLLFAPTGDTNFQWESVDRIAAAAQAIYTLHGAKDRLQVVHPDGGHDFPDEAREQAYRLLERVLK